MIKVVVFDLDDTLILERNYIKSGFNAVAKRISEDFHMDEANISKVMNDVFNVSSKNVFNNTLSILGICSGDSYIKELVKIYRGHKPDIVLEEDAKDIINYLLNKGYKLGIITDGYGQAQRRKVEALNICELFHYIILTDELGREFWKPHERPYILMKEKLNVEFNEMIYVGDNVLKDFVTAKELGIKTVRIKRDNGIYSKEECAEAFCPHVQLSSFSELIKLLEFIDK